MSEPIAGTKLRGNWEHALVGDAHTYTLQAGSGSVLIERRPPKQASGVRESDEGFSTFVPIDELRELVAEWDATVGPYREKKSWEEKP